MKHFDFPDALLNRKKTQKKCCEDGAEVTECVRPAEVMVQVTIQGV